MTTTQSIKNYARGTSTITVSISDFILTPAACAFLVNEVMKNLLYQRSQIPYPYAWLKSIVNKKRRSFEDTETGTEASNNFTLSRHFHVVSAAYDAAESVMTNIIRLFTRYGSNVKEVVFVMGVTPVSPKEVFTIRVSSMAQGHVERNHVNENSKKQPKILREIFLENSWMNLLESPISCSNTYMFLKLYGEHITSVVEEDIFIRSKPLVIASNVKHTVVYLNYTETENSLCCDKLEVFNDAPNADNLNNASCAIIKETKNHIDPEIWLQSKILIKGFKDCFINKVSASDLW